ncbi:MAG: hypothetical protein KF764_35310 [Labilithrix sp.]|nr:hypothetical protein [Labilithrix sp.]
MSDSDPRDIPDLDLPPPRGSSPSVKVPSARPKSAPAQPVAGASSALGDDFGMELERGPAVSAPPAGIPSRAPGAKNVAIDFKDESDDGFGDMEIERGGAVVSLPPSMSGRPSGPPSGRPASLSGRPASSGLDVGYRRMDAKPSGPRGPSTVAKILAWVLPTVLTTAALAGLVKVAHRAAGRNVMALAPHAFDASSTWQSGAVAATALVLAIALGFTGLRLRPRSYAMLGSAAALVVASLAMVTVTLVSTEEHPAPPDGALLIPYVIPFAVFTLGLGVAGRGPSLFLRGGARRAASALAALAGGAIVFAAIEISALASRLP